MGLLLVGKDLSYLDKYDAEGDGQTRVPTTRPSSVRAAPLFGWVRIGLRAVIDRPRVVRAAKAFAEAYACSHHSGASARPPRALPSRAARSYPHAAVLALYRMATLP